MPEVTEKPDEKPASFPLTKQSFRRKVWEHLEKNNLVTFPRPVYGRIPNFKGCEQTAVSLAGLDVFKHAQNVNVNPDKPQQAVRFAVLDNTKNLYVPVPKLTNGLLKHIQLPVNAIKDDLSRAVSRKGIDECGKEVGLEDNLKIDLVVLGSVAVSKDGLRIGKGRGYADLEFAILSHMKAVNQNTVVVTTVHDSQVYSTLPEELFGPHDVPVDIIVTPTEIIHVEKRRTKPDGIIWNILSQRRLDMMPILKLLRDIDEKDGKYVTLKEVDTDIENGLPNRRPYRRMRRLPYTRRPRPVTQDGDASESQPEEKAAGHESENRRRRFVRRRPQQDRAVSENGNTTTNEDSASPKRKPKRQYRKNKPMIDFDFSLKIRNIERTVRVRDVKAALAERGIKPNIITWRGVKGYCCLHFSKSNPNTISDAESQSHGVDNVINLLQNFKVSPDAKKDLEIEIMKPISRIETTDVTSV